MQTPWVREVDGLPSRARAGLGPGKHELDGVSNLNATECGPIVEWSPRHTGGFELVRGV